MAWCNARYAGALKATRPMRCLACALAGALLLPQLLAGCTVVAVTVAAGAVGATTGQPASSCGSSKAPARAQARQRMGRVAFGGPGCLAWRPARG